MGDSNKPQIKVEGKMSEIGTDRVALAQAIGYIMNGLLWRIGLIIVLYQSPDLINEVKDLL